MMRGKGVYVLIASAIGLLLIVVGIISIIESDFAGSPDSGEESTSKSLASPTEILPERPNGSAREEGASLNEEIESFSPAEGITVKEDTNKQGTTFHMDSVEWEEYQYVTKDGETVTLRVPPGQLPPPGVEGERFPLD